MNLIHNMLLAKKIKMEIDPACIFVPESGSELNAYTVILRHGNRKLKLPQADRKKKKPSAFTILEALVDDAAMFDRTGTYESWCKEFGCEVTDEIARREYRQVSWYTDALKRFLGPDCYQQSIKEWEEKYAAFLS